MPHMSLTSSSLLHWPMVGGWIGALFSVTINEVLSDSLIVQTLLCHCIHILSCLLFSIMLTTQPQPPSLPVCHLFDLLLIVKKSVVKIHRHDSYTSHNSVKAGTKFYHSLRCVSVSPYDAEYGRHQNRYGEWMTDWMNDKLWLPSSLPAQWF